MAKVLLTGVSGVGKSSLIDRLASRGYRAVDLDDEAWSRWVPFTPHPDAPESDPPEREWVWRTDRVRRLLDSKDDVLLFVSGCASNMGEVLGAFDYVVLLSAPAEIVQSRLERRSPPAFGAKEEDQRRVGEHIEHVEPLLRARATHEIVTDTSVSEAVDHLLRIVRTEPS